MTNEEIRQTLTQLRQELEAQKTANAKLEKETVRIRCVKIVNWTSLECKANISFESKLKIYLDRKINVFRL